MTAHLAIVEIPPETDVPGLTPVERRKESDRLRHQKYRREHPEKDKDAHRRYREKNLEKIRAADRARGSKRNVDPAKARETRRRWIEKNYEKEKERNRLRVNAWARAHPIEARERNLRGSLKRLCGITLEMWVAALIMQSGRCAACGDPLCGAKEPVVDHDHATGAFRALLCQRCNFAVGHAKDSPTRLRQMADYLETFK